MSIRITCPECKSVCKVEDDQRGKKVRCRECDRLLSVPAGGTKIVAKDAEDDEGFYDARSKAAPASKRRDRDDDDDRPAARRDRDGGAPAVAKKGGSGLLAVLLIAGGGVVALGLVGVLLIVAILFVWTSAPDGRNVAIAVNDVPAFPRPPAAPPPPPQAFKPEPIEQNRDPVVKDPGPGIKDPVPADPGPAPDKIAADTLKAVKQSTVYLRVIMSNGMQAEGSGFFAVEPGVIITNAHVLGMLGAQSMPPASVDVIVHAGEPNAITLKGVVAGVDRSTDLAVVRVPSNGLPPPLPVDSTRKLADLQKVYILGFPFGKKAATNVTVSEAAISGLGKDKTGAVDQVRLTGDMQPGNSGGPVVDAAGRVIGVSVAIMRGTRINFAVPADFIKLILDGRLADSRYGEPFFNNNQTLLPVKFQCLDPLQRVKDFRIEVWTGSHGPDRPFGSVQPPAMPGDSARQTIAIGYNSGKAMADIPLPQLPPGQVYWLQPVLVDGAGVTQWQPASTLTARVPLKRVPANLLMKLDPQGQERTVQLKNETRINIYQGKEKYTEGQHFDAAFLEVLTPSPKGTAIRVTIGANKFAEEENGMIRPIEAMYFTRFSRLSPSFVINPATGKFFGHFTPDLKAGLPKKDKDTLEMLMSRFCNAYEEVFLYTPNRQVNPMESWQASLPTIIGKAPKHKVVDIVLNCTYEGCRSTNGRNEAFISLVGAIKGRDKDNREPRGRVVGRAMLDLDAGFLSQINMRLTTEMDLGPAQLVISEDISLTRTSGNTQNIVAFVPKKGPPIGPELRPKTDPPTKPDLTPPPRPELTPAGPRLIFEAINARIVPSDLLGPKARKCKTYDVKLEAGKTYVIEMKKAGATTFNPFLLLLDVGGKVVAQDDDSGENKNAKIRFNAKQSGTYKVVATSSIGQQIGAYHLSVTAVPPEKKE
jgi:S1-C subfamily serine protease